MSYFFRATLSVPLYDHMMVVTSHFCRDRDVPIGWKAEREGIVGVEQCVVLCVEAGCS
jgi:hypothetical protein